MEKQLISQRKTILLLSIGWIISVATLIAICIGSVIGAILWSQYKADVGFQAQKSLINQAHLAYTESLKAQQLAKISQLKNKYEYKLATFEAENEQLKKSILLRKQRYLVSGKNQPVSDEQATKDP